ncbi:DUF2808 domain-containing protein [Stenomitos frigidus]|uniref:DUF2808 domain-containing protein n=1 Tax=Stenomitos frigidus ULC18 TaxID=2107698 RepID=A0A2T1ENR0_9CYAN|nr:DUF2808 domain-containing protein [Stenomitos frigidus]PSB34366.1 hypothetical protein C7B82_02555 [Stenomitos frigidus ULC18]
MAQPAAFSQSFKNSTHPTLADLTAAPAIRVQAAPPQAAPLPAVERHSTSTQLSSRQTFFAHPPSLNRVAASQSGRYTPSTYEFTLTIPADAGQPLKAVTIAQATNLETIKFDVGQSKAFAGGRFAAGPEIPLASVGGSQPANPGEVTVVFDQPLQPGSTVTVAIAANANPSFGGTYEFGVTAYPEGENGRGQFLGYGRLNFYSNSN